MSVSVGIVGLPNVGKSSLFNVLTCSNIEASNYPFCTIAPNVGMAEVPDPRLKVLQELTSAKKMIPAITQWVDIAGLVRGASRGEGLGNQFLSHVRQVSIIVHVVRCFEDDQIIHVHERVDPIADVELIELELCLADLQVIQKSQEKHLKLSKAPGKEGEVARQRLGFLEIMQQGLEQAKPIRMLGLPPEAMGFVQELQLITAKPVIYCANTNHFDHAHVASLKRHADAQGAHCVALSVQLEAELMTLPEEERLVFLEELGWQEPGLHRLIRIAYDVLGLQTMLTAGEQEVRAWTVPKGVLAPQAAGVIHSDFEKGFIRVEVITYEDFVALGGASKARSQGKMRTEGKDYRLQEADVVHFLIQKNVK